MKTLFANSNGTDRSDVTLHSKLRKILLICGALSSLLYVGMDVLAGTRWQHYSWISQEFSRLSSIGAPSRPVILVLSPFYTLLVLAFGLGVWSSVGQKRSLGVVGGSLVGYAMVSLVWPLFFPEDLIMPPDPQEVQGIFRYTYIDEPVRTGLEVQALFQSAPRTG